MAEAAWRVELTASFLQRLDAIKVSSTEADGSLAFYKLLGVLRKPVIRKGIFSIAGTALPVALGVQWCASKANG